MNNINIEVMEERVKDLKFMEGLALKEGDLKRAGLARGEANVLIGLLWNGGYS